MYFTSHPRQIGGMASRCVSVLDWFTCRVLSYLPEMRPQCWRLEVLLFSQTAMALTGSELTATIDSNLSLLYVNVSSLRQSPGLLLPFSHWKQFVQWSYRPRSQTTYQPDMEREKKCGQSNASTACNSLRGVRGVEGSFMSLTFVIWMEFVMTVLEY